MHDNDAEDNDMQNQTKKTYEQPEMKTLGSYLEMTQTDMTSIDFDGGPPGTCGNVSQLS